MLLGEAEAGLDAEDGDARKENEKRHVIRSRNASDPKEDIARHQIEQRPEDIDGR